MAPLAAAIVAVQALLAVVSASAETSDAGFAAFAAENETAMCRMMADMHAPLSGDIDRDFAAMMIPHHQGAIDMAIAQLRYGRNEQLRRIAQEIIVEQQQEIAAMRLAIGLPLPPSAPVPTQIAAAPGAASATVALGSPVPVPGAHASHRKCRP